ASRGATTPFSRGAGGDEGAGPRTVQFGSIGRSADDENAVIVRKEKCGMRPSRRGHVSCRDECCAASRKQFGRGQVLGSVGSAGDQHAAVQEGRGGMRRALGRKIRTTRDGS